LKPLTFDLTLADLDSLTQLLISTETELLKLYNFQLQALVIFKHLRFVPETLLLILALAYFNKVV
jgi:hypothetical protein